MNPVPVMALVEVIRGIATPDETTDAAVALATAGKTPLVPGLPRFVSNRVLMPMLNEAFYVLTKECDPGRRGRHHEARHEPPDGAADVADS